MDLMPIMRYVAQQNTDLVAGENLFVYSMPAQIPSGVLIVLDPSGAYVDHEIKGAYKNQLQIIVRHAVYETGYDLAMNLFSMLDLERVEMDDLFFYYLRPRHLPFSFRKGASDLMEFSINFDAYFSIVQEPSGNSSVTVV